MHLTFRTVLSISVLLPKWSKDVTSSLLTAWCLTTCANVPKPKTKLNGFPFISQSWFNLQHRTDVFFVSVVKEQDQSLFFGINKYSPLLFLGFFLPSVTRPSIANFILPKIKMKQITLWEEQPLPLIAEPRHPEDQNAVLWVSKVLRLTWCPLIITAVRYKFNALLALGLTL